MRLLLVFVISLGLVLPVFGQQSGRKPVLIRPDEGSQEGSQEAPLVPDPGKARESVAIGDFYYRRDNDRAAADRYREAILYNPQWPEAYEKLVRVLKKQKAFTEAIQACEQFVLANPSSGEVNRFRKWAEELKRESDKAVEESG